MQCQGHTSYVNTAVYMHDGAKVVTGSADGTVKVRISVLREATTDGETKKTSDGGSVDFPLDKVIRANRESTSEQLVAWFDPSEC